MLKADRKNKIPQFDKSMVINQLKCYCDSCYIDLRTRQLKKRVNEILACIDKFLNLPEKLKDKKSNKIVNAIKRSVIVEQSVYNQGCAKSFNLERFKIIKSCSVYD